MSDKTAEATEFAPPEPIMTRPRRYLKWMAAFLVVAAAVAVVLFSGLQSAFLANPGLNGLIVGVFIIGVVIVFRQVLRLEPEVRWIEQQNRSEDAIAVSNPPELLSPMAAMLGEQKRGRMSLSAVSMRTLLDGIAVRLDESRDVTRYLVGLLIFLGLLGTFWGLLQTVTSIGSAIGGLSVGSGDIGIMFDTLKRGLEAPLAGMGTAFSSSLFGLIGSLILGFLDLQAGKAQNRFFNDLEEWLSKVTRLSSGGGLGEGDQSVPAYVSALLEQTAESVDDLRRTISRSEEDRSQTNAALMGLAERLANLTDLMRSGQSSVVHLDDATRDHFRNLDVHMLRLVDETARGRQQMIDELRSEIKLLSRTLSAMTEGRGQK
jgi:hypothetical protein